MSETLLELKGIRKEYRLRQPLVQRLRGEPRRSVVAVDGVSLAIPKGAVFGLVGESGSGKSTLAQIMVRLIEPTSGQLNFRGEDVLRMDSVRSKAFRHGVQMVFQDTGSSLNPRKRVGRTVTEALAARGVAAAELPRLLDRVGLDATLAGRFPHELSGGQRQRVGIARALAVADEPVSALDVSLQGQIINLLQELNADLGLTIVLISHDLAVVARVCSALAVMSEGKLVEEGIPQQVLTSPRHAYTQSLLAAVPRGLDGRRRADRVGN